MARTMAENWLLFVARRGGERIAASLIAIDRGAHGALTAATGARLEHVDCLHFEACYYQPLQWCIAHGYRRFEGGAQGEHKMARGLMPVQTPSAHWLAHPRSRARWTSSCAREGAGVRGYVDELNERPPVQGV